MSRHLWKTRWLIVTDAIAQGWAEILADIASGTLPYDIACFADCHDYVDANEYGSLDAEIEFSEGTYCRLMNLRTDALNALLVQRYTRLELGPHTQLGGPPSECTTKAHDESE
mgnify:CR=1 FL=1